MTTDAHIALSEDQQAVAQKKIADLHHAVGTICSRIKEGKPLDTTLARNCLAVAEFNLSDLCKALSIETDGTAERAQRYAELRRANLRIRDLEAQIGATLSPEATTHSISNIAEHLNKWWRHEGFGFAHELHFGQYGVCHAQLTCTLNGSFPLLDSETPVSDKKNKAAWIESIRERGFELVKDDREWAIRDCDASREALISLVANRLPSAKIVRFANYNRWRSSGFVLRHAEVCVYKLAEIMALPIPATEQDE